MAKLVEAAPAKLNITLKVEGRRRDGYHEIESLTVFLDLADQVSLAPDGALGLEIEGPFAALLSGGNLILDAAAAAKAAVPDLALGRFHLDKQIPVAAGLGGGSADAAAALRLLRQVARGRLSAERLKAIASALGADVTACLQSDSVIMRGRGDELAPLRLPAFSVVLANPGSGLTAGEIYTALDAAPLPETFRASGKDIDFGDEFLALVAYLEQHGNDLQPPAIAKAPVVANLIEALGALQGAHCPRLSGSGPTCFAVFETQDAAKAAAAELARKFPDWWVAASRVRAGVQALEAQ